MTTQTISSDSLAPVTYQNIGNFNGFLIVPRGTGTVNIYNGDIANVLLVSSSPSPSLSNSLPIQPLTNATVDGSRQLYGRALSGTVASATVSSSSQLSPSPAQIAQQISALGLAKDTTVQTTNTVLGSPAQDGSLGTINTTLGVPAQRTDVQGLTVGGVPGGVPLLRGTSNLGFGTNVNIPANGTSTLLNTVGIVDPGYEAVFKLSFPAASGTNPFCVVVLSWTDSFTGLQVGLKAYVMIAGNGPANAVQYYLSGPCRGNQLTMAVQNLDAAVAGTLTWAVNTTSHLYLYDKYLQPLIPSNPNGFSYGAGNPSRGTIIASAPTIGPNASVTRLTAATNAKCKMFIDNSTGLNNMTISFQDPGVGGSVYGMAIANMTFVKFGINAGQSVTQEFQMPNGPVNALIANVQATNNIQPTVVITTMEY